MLETGINLIYWVLLLFCRIEDFSSQHKKSEEHLKRKDVTINELQIRFVYISFGDVRKWLIFEESYL